jgi:hypothetical protein
MGALVPVLTALLARELWPEDRVLALLAAALAALCGQLWQSSVVVMADTSGLALATFAAWSLAHYARGGRGGWLVAAGAALAYATLARWIYGLVAIPFALYALSVLRRREHSQWTHALAALAVASLILVPVVGPSALGLLSHPAEPAAFAGNLQVYSWSPLNAFRREFQTPDGHLAYTLPNGVYYATAPANLAFFGPLLAPWILVGLYAGRRWPGRTWVLIVGWAAVVYAFHAGAPWQNFRFALAYLPPLAILAAAGLLAVQRRITRTARALVPAVAAIGLVVSAASAVRLEKTFIDRKDDELALVRWVDGQLPAGSQLLTFGPTLAFRHYSSLTTYDLFELQRRDQLEATLAVPAPHYLLVDEASIEGQWLDQAPSANFQLIRDGPGLTQIATDQSYTLYRVGAP